MNNSDTKYLWYSAGLHFECYKCGRCCSGPSEGYIWVRRPEIQLIANHLSMSVKELKQKYLKRIGLRLSVIEDSHSRDCVFLRETQEGKSCSIYPVRPAQCRSWPFWPSNLTGPDNWNLAAQRCAGINRGQSYTPDQIQTIQNTKHWWLPENNKGLIQQVQDIYTWLDEQLKSKSPDCGSCGRCCDFDTYDHRLFVTSPEILFFADKLGPGNIKKMTNGRCPYQAVAPDGETSPASTRLSEAGPKGGAENKCTVYPYRFAGCRIFSCKGNPDFQSDLTEEVIKKFKSLCDEFNVPYRYLDLPSALMNFLTTEGTKIHRDGF